MYRMLPKGNYYRAPHRGRVGQRGNDHAESRGSANPELESEARTPIVEQPPPPPPIVMPVLQLDPRVLAETIITTLTAQEKRRKPGDIIEHAKKCGAFDFHGSINSREADRWLKATEKAFNTLELIEV